MTAVVAVAALWPSATSLQALWRDIHDYQYGYVIAAVSAFWFGTRARKLWSRWPQPGLVGCGLLAATLAAWLIVLNANSVIAHQLLFPAAIWAALFAATGLKIARQVAAPIAYLYFAIPVWDFFLPVLQRLSVLVTETTLSLLGVSAVVHEYTVTIPEGTFQIVEGCSGKRYFMVTLAVAVLAAAMSRMRRWRLLGFVAACGALALVANWIRIVIVIYAGHATNMQHYFVAVEHLTLGNVIFAVVLVVVLVVARRFHSAPTVPPPTDDTVAIRAGRAIIPSVLLVAVMGVVQWRAHATPHVAKLGTAPVMTRTWQGPLPPAPAWEPRYVAPDAEYRAAYSGVGGTVEVYINAYGEQRQGRELVGYGNHLLAPGSWDRAWPLRRGTIRADAATLAAFEARSADGDLWFLAYTLEIGGWRTASGPLEQLAYGVRSLFRPAPAGLIALAARCDTNCEAARALVASFWDDMSLPLLALVPDKEPN